MKDLDERNGGIWVELALVLDLGLGEESLKALQSDHAL